MEIHKHLFTMDPQSGCITFYLTEIAKCFKEKQVTIITDKFYYRNHTIQVIMDQNGMFQDGTISLKIWKDLYCLASHAFLVRFPSPDNEIPYIFQYCMLNSLLLEAEHERERLKNTTKVSR